MASWTGITAVTAYSPVLLSQAGYSKIKQNGLAGGFNTIGIIGAIISAQIVDRLGRRKCLMLGSAVLFTVEIAIAGSIYEGSLRHPDKATQYAPGAVAMLFLFNLGRILVMQQLGHGSFPHTHGDFPFRLASSRKRLWYNGLGRLAWE